MKIEQPNGRKEYQIDDTGHGTARKQAKEPKLRQETISGALLLFEHHFGVVIGQKELFLVNFFSTHP
jgi:hypothetical protein